MRAPTGSAAASFSNQALARGRLYVLAATVFWGTTATLARFVFRDREVPALTVVEIRLAVAALLLGAWLAGRHPEALRVRREDWGYFLVLGVLGVATVQGTYYYSISVLGVGLAILLQYLAPCLLVIYDAIRGVPVRPLTVVAVLGALLGTGLLVGGVDRVTLNASPWQWAIGFSSALAFSFYILYSKRGLRHYRPETVLFYTFVIAALVWAVVTPPWRIASAGYDAGLWGMFAVLGIFSTLVPFSLFYAGLRQLPAAQVGILATLEPVVAVVSAAVFLAENLGLAQWAGAVMVLAASTLASRHHAPETIAAQAEHG
ncbi:MAG TPA: DMT family transporter [Candidatus Limnocylindria bacterium]|nr:DMT family transporter [Candidatus Limnocylindria bacterium]